MALFELASPEYYQTLSNVSEEIHEKISTASIVGIQNLASKINDKSSPGEIRAIVREIGLHVNGLTYLVPDIHITATEMIKTPIKVWTETFAKDNNIDHKILQDLWSCNNPFQPKGGFLLWEELYVFAQSCIEQKHNN